MGSKVIVRRATSSDARNISRALSLSSAHRENYLAEALTKRFLASTQIDKRLSEGLIWVAETDGEIVGSISLRSDEDGLHIRSFAVRNGFQEQLVAPELLRAVNEFAEVGEITAHLISEFYTQLVRVSEYGRL